MNIYKTKNGVNYYISYDGNLSEELKWYKSFLCPLIKKLFNKNVKVLSKKTTANITIYSKTILLFLHEKCGLPLGRKSNYEFPNIILKSNPEIKRAFLKGLADADFSLAFKARHKNINYYPVIDHQTSDEVLHNSVKKMLRELNFKFYSNFRFQERKGKIHKGYYIQINGVSMLNKWMSEIGFNSPVQLTKYLLWKKQGFVPPGTSLSMRENLLRK